MFGLSLHTWENVMLAMLGVVGIAGVGVGLATYAVVQLQRMELGHLAAEAARANESAGKAHERTAELEKDAAGLKAQAEADRLARLKIEARIAPRSLTQAQQNELTAKLSQFKDVRGTIVASPSTPESEMFVRVLGAPLNAAGWSIGILPGTTTATVLFPAGVIVRYPIEVAGSVTMTPDGKLTVPPGPWGPLTDALNELGIEATALPEPRMGPHNIAIIVTAK